MGRRTDSRPFPRIGGIHLRHTWFTSNQSAHAVCLRADGRGSTARKYVTSVDAMDKCLVFILVGLKLHAQHVAIIEGTPPPLAPDSPPAPSSLHCSLSTTPCVAARALSQGGFTCRAAAPCARVYQSRAAGFGWRGQCRGWGARWLSLWGHGPLSHLP